MSARDRMFAALRAAATATDRDTERMSLHARLDALAFRAGAADVALFTTRARESGSTVLRCADLSDAARTIVALVEEGQRCILADDPLCASMGLAAGLAGKSCSVTAVRDITLGRDNPDARRAYADAHVGITVARAGLADSGAIIISSSDCESRSVSLLPARHIAMLPAGRIVASLRQAAPLLRHLALDATSAVTLVGGPSKTADIEKVLVTGVHGPGEFVIVIIDDAEGQ
ncbi:MAG: LUD domain-containing protein [Bacteroidota bacterium]|nr:LUD domain-containing protein [Bacteroidota bacterium]